MNESVTFVDFYRAQAERFSQIAHTTLESRYTSKTHPGLRGDQDLILRLRSLVPQAARGLDAGCGAGARDVFLYWQSGYDIHGFDIVDENIRLVRETHPEISNWVQVADIAAGLPYPDGDFDFVLCNAVIQHVDHSECFEKVLPELCRVLRQGGILQLMFKSGFGETTIFDPEYKLDRRFHLYEPEEIVTRLNELCLTVVPEEDNALGGVMLFTDPKPMEHCVLFAEKTND